MVETLMDRQRTYGGVFGADLFPYPAPSRLLRIDHYWSGRAESSWSVWVDANHGRTRLIDRGRAEDDFQVYCVRATDGGPTPTVIRRCFQRDPEASDSIVEDLGTGLVWTACPSGVAGAACDEGAQRSFSHRQAIEYCETLEYAGHDDWMMPTVDQLNSLTDDVPEERGQRRTGFATGIFGFDLALWALDRVGYYGYSSFYFLSAARPLRIENRIESSNVATLCVRRGPWAQTIEYPQDSCRTVAPLRLDAHWDGEGARLILIPGEEAHPGHPVVNDHLYGVDWTGCLSGSSGDTCEDGARRHFDPGRDAGDFCRNLEWAGHADWRLPEYREYAGLVDFNSQASPPLAPGVGERFPQLVDGNRYSLHLRTREFVDSGNMNFVGAGRNAGPAYCVRDRDDGPPRTEIQCVETNAWHANEPTVTDALHGYQWTACPTGQNGRDCVGGLPVQVTHEQAGNACQDLNWAGRDDWRLPSMAEFASLVDQNYNAEAAYSDVEAFPFMANAPSAPFWTRDVRSERDGWMGQQHPRPDSLGSRRLARCVRDL
jgi:hypothetical protein